MRDNKFRRLVWSALLVLGLSTVGAASPSFAQQDTGAARVQTTHDNDDDGMDWGWLGLLGLAGLLGLRRRAPEYTRDRADVGTTQTRP